MALALGAACAGTEPLFPQNASVLVACSGGADSVALAAGLASVAASTPALGLRVLLAHVDHGLRPESAEEARGVALLADRLGVGFALATLDGASLLREARHQGLEAAARRTRYQALSALARTEGATHLATGHTRRDQAETVLLRLARGGGLGALAGVRARRRLGELWLVRPLLGVGRDQTEALCARLGLPFTTDPHNQDPRFSRARVRAAFASLDALLGPRLEEALARAAEVAAGEDALLSSLAAEASAQASRAGGALAVPVLAGLPLALQRRVLSGAAAGAGLRPTLAQLDHLRALLAKPEAALSLPGGTALLSGGLIRFQLGPARASPPAALEPVAVPGPGRYLFGGLRLEVSPERGTAPSLPIDTGLAPLPWTLRAALPGDRFRPGGGRQKKVSDLWIDAKVSRALRPRLALLCDAAGGVFFVEGLRPGAAGRAAGSTVLYLTLAREDAR